MQRQVGRNSLGKTRKWDESHLGRPQSNSSVERVSALKHKLEESGSPVTYVTLVASGQCVDVGAARAG